MTWIINIQSITDIITNSSSETFVIPYKGVEQKIYKLINSIFIASGIPTRAEDIISITRKENYYGSTEYDTLEITCKDPEAKEICDLIDDVLNGFYAETIYG